MIYCIKYKYILFRIICKIINYYYCVGHSSRIVHVGSTLNDVSHNILYSIVLFRKDLNWLRWCANVGTSTEWHHDGAFDRLPVVCFRNLFYNNSLTMYIDHCLNDLFAFWKVIFFRAIETLAIILSQRICIFCFLKKIKVWIYKQSKGLL